MKKTENKKNKAKKIFVICWLLVFLGIITFVIYFLLTSSGSLGYMPNFAELENTNENLATKIWSEDEILLGTYFKENRSQKSYDELSDTLITALICTEDVRFYEHSGIDFKALPRVFSGLAGKSTKGGGSTITQQLAKMLFPREVNMSKIKLIHRKFQEWIIAVKLERTYTKEEIISMYLNKFDFLNLAVGIESASRVYFNTTPDKLTITQSSMLVGMAKNPSLFNPIRREKQTLERRNVVLSQMVKYGKLTKERYDSLKNVPLGIDYHPVDHNVGNATYFREFLRLWLTAKKPIKENYIDERDYVEDSINWNSESSYGWFTKNSKADGSSYDLYRDGLQIHTTINSRMQKYAEEAIVEHIGTYLQPAFFKDQRGNSKPPFGNDVTKDDIEKIMRSSMRRTERWIEMRNSGIKEEEIEASFYKPVAMEVFSWNQKGDTTMICEIFKKLLENDRKNGKIEENTISYKIFSEWIKDDTIINRYKKDKIIMEKNFKRIKILDASNNKYSNNIYVEMSPYDSILYYKHFLRTGFMSMEPESGYVRAFVGGIDYRYFKYDQVTKARRQIGSTIKPFIYCLAMQNKLSPCTKVPNIEVSFKINKGKTEEIYTPKYSPTKLDGEMITLKQGLANSLNQISAWVLKQYATGYNNNYSGVQNIVDIAKSMGVNSPIDAVPSICVGSAEVLISELVASYCAFTNKGEGIRPLYITKITDKNGNIIQSFTPQKFGTKINEETAFLMLELMKAVIDEGTGIRLRYSYGFKGDIAGKTGTTNNNSDGWFMGITPQLVSGVWVGGEERSIRFRYMDFGQGAVLALPIWAIYMKKVFNDPILEKRLHYSQDVKFKQPAELSVDINCDKYNNSNGGHGSYND